MFSIHASCNDYDDQCDAGFHYMTPFDEPRRSVYPYVPRGPLPVGIKGSLGHMSHLSILCSLINAHANAKSDPALALRSPHPSSLCSLPATEPKYKFAPGAFLPKASPALSLAPRLFPAHFQQD